MSNSESEADQTPVEQDKTQDDSVASIQEDETEEPARVINNEFIFWCLK